MGNIPASRTDTLFSGWRSWTIRSFPFFLSTQNHMDRYDDTLGSYTPASIFNFNTSLTFSFIPGGTVGIMYESFSVPRSISSKATSGRERKASPLLRDRAADPAFWRHHCRDRPHLPVHLLSHAVGKMIVSSSSSNSVRSISSLCVLGQLLPSSSARQIAVNCQLRSLATDRPHIVRKRDISSRFGDMNICILENTHSAQDLEYLLLPGLLVGPAAVSELNVTVLNEKSAAETESRAGVVETWVLNPLTRKK
ncbi:hypothetical protein PM082_024396 [Marasmius tenuissimus]|nr:hypothetical protein PM082_024396 [Marasmius tenuissimus]